MNIVTPIYQGGVEGFNHFITPAENFDGVLTKINQGTPLLVFALGTIAPIALEFMQVGKGASPEFVLVSAAAVVGAVKATNGINFYRGEFDRLPLTINAIFNSFLTQTLFLTGGVLLAKSVFPIVNNISPLNGGLIALGAGVIGAITGGALKKVVEG